ncbi:MAG TPA: hypothetical protein PLT63_03570 [Syntrophales bacterium]|nr:hypothetical protein [Syntrophales bacterium]
MTELALCLILISVLVLAVCILHAAGVMLVRWRSYRTGKREYRIVQRVL